MRSDTLCRPNIKRFLSYKHLPALSSNSQNRSLGEEDKGSNRKMDQHWLDRHAARRVLGRRERMPPNSSNAESECPYSVWLTSSKLMIVPHPS